ncbi:protein eva-1-like protein B-like [Huso huso]|uniref:Protein eva-1-like protein B-like n=1 Tax=Huso huso TaxID=61971 RepID=A0ABR0YPH1_HUSHU
MDVKKKEMDLLSNSIAAYAHIKGASLTSIRDLLILTLCLLVIRISCKPRTKPRAEPVPAKKALRDFSEEEEDDESEEDETDAPNPTTEITMGNHSQSDGTLSMNVFTSAEELERAQRLEERERIIREIWRNGQPDILGTGTGTVGRVQYY